MTTFVALQNLRHFDNWLTLISNQLIHFIFVPVITFSATMILISRPFTFSSEPIAFIAPWIDIKLDAALILITVLSFYYILLDLFVGLTLLIQLWGFVFLANFLYAHTSTTSYILVILACQIIGWGTQFFGHWIEGRRPALVDNLFQIFNAPYFVMIEAFFYFGYKPELYNKIKKELEKRRRI